jgi:hypothetical protein
MRAVSIADNAEYRRFLAFQGMLSAQQRHSFGGCFAGPLNAIPIHWLSTSSLMSTMGAPDEASLGPWATVGAWGQKWLGINARNQTCFILKIASI